MRAWRIKIDLGNLQGKIAQTKPMKCGMNMNEPGSPEWPFRAFEMTFSGVWDWSGDLKQLQYGSWNAYSTNHRLRRNLASQGLEIMILFFFHSVIIWNIIWNIMPGTVIFCFFIRIIIKIIISMLRNIMLENASFVFSAELSSKFSYPMSFLGSRTAEHTMSTFQVADICLFCVSASGPASKIQLYGLYYSIHLFGSRDPRSQTCRNEQHNPWADSM